MKLRNALTLTAFVLVLAACASLGNEPAQTFNQRFAYAVGVHQAIVDATQSSYEAGQLDRSDAVSIDVQAHNARGVLDAAKTAHDAGDEAGANAKLAVALTALQELQNYLRAHGAPK